MTIYGSADVGFLLINGYNVLSEMTELEDTEEAIIEDTTVLGADHETHQAVGIKSYRLTQKGFYNSDTGKTNQALITPGNDKILSFAPRGNANGLIVPSSGLVQVNYNRLLSRGALHKANAEYLSQHGHDAARIIHALAARTADGNSQASSVDGSAGSSAGGVAYLQVTALTLGGYDDVTITLQDSTDNISFATLQAFTDVAAAPSAQRIEIAGTVDRYLAVSWAFNGAGTSPSIEFMVGFKRN